MPGWNLYATEVHVWLREINPVYQGRAKVTESIDIISFWRYSFQVNPSDSSGSSSFYLQLYPQTQGDTPPVPHSPASCRARPCLQLLGLAAEGSASYSTSGFCPEDTANPLSPFLLLVKSSRLVFICWVSCSGQKGDASRPKALPSAEVEAITITALGVQASGHSSVLQIIRELAHFPAQSVYGFSHRPALHLTLAAGL